MKILLVLLVSLFALQCSQNSESSDGKPSTSEGSSGEGRIEEIVEPNAVFRFAVISDLNSSYGSTTYVNDVSKAVEWIADSQNKVDFAISTGDMVAGQKSGLNYQAMWTAFHSVVTQPLAQSTIPLLPSPGNHDAHVSRAIEREHYKNSWNQQKSLTLKPQVQLVSGVPQNYPFQYAFKVGSGLFLAMDSTTVQPWSDSTLAWIESVFKAEPEARFKVIFGHVPLLPFAYTKETEYTANGSLTFLNKLEKLLEDYQVDFFLSGHSHVYYPGRRDAHTQFMSIPLLGTGSRYLIGAENLGLSQRGFLVFEFNNQGDWSYTHHKASDSSPVSDESSPPAIVMPVSNTNLCKSCSQFPKSHFLDSSKRILYRRQDL